MSSHTPSTTLTNIADDLAALAEDLARGKLRVGNRLLAVGNPLFMKTKQKITGDTAYFTLSFQVPLLDSDQVAIPIEDELKRNPEKKIDSRHDKGMRLQGRPPEGKKLKKEIATLWKSISGKLEQGQMPTPAQEKAIVAAFENYTVFTEPAWHEEWRSCFTLLREALTCARMGDMPKALEYALKVDDLTKTCHKKYK